jgi:surface protein
MTDMQSMFFSCSALTMLDLSSFNTSKVTSMNGMFLGCNKLEVVDISSFDISNVTDLYMMFSGCTKLKTIYCSNDWSTSTARSDYMFSVCNSLVGGKGTVFDSKVIDNTYARPDGGESAPGYFTDDSLTRINSLTPALSKGEGAIYNLSGQRVNKPVQKGLYIINGKKKSVK